MADLGEIISKACLQDFGFSVPEPCYAATYKGIQHKSIVSSFVCICETDLCNGASILSIRTVNYMSIGILVLHHFMQ